MNALKRAVIYASAVLVTIFAALITDAFFSFGNPEYARSYPADRLCAQVNVGATLNEIQTRITSLGRPESIEYNGIRLTVSGGGSVCLIDLDPASNRVTKISTSRAPILF